MLHGVVRETSPREYSRTSRDVTPSVRPGRAVRVAQIPTNVSYSSHMAKFASVYQCLPVSAVKVRKYLMEQD